MAGLAIDSPVTLAEALRSARILPGDVLELADGVYHGAYVSGISGTEAAPVIIKPRNPGMVTIDGTLTINGQYTTWQDLDFTDSAADRTYFTGAGLTMNYAGTRIIGCKFYDERGSNISWMGTGVGEISECLFYRMADRGHHIYSHNSATSLRKIERCLFDATNNYGLHVYSAGENALYDYQITNNVHRAPAIAGGGLGLKNLVYTGNIHCANYLYLGRYKIDGGVDVNCVANDNILIDAPSVIISDKESFTCADNLVYGNTVLDVGNGWTVTEKPATLSYTIPFTLSQRWAGLSVNYVTSTGEFTVEVIAA